MTTLVIVTPSGPDFSFATDSIAQASIVGDADYVITEDGRILKDRLGDLKVEKI